MKTFVALFVLLTFICTFKSNSQNVDIDILKTINLHATRIKNDYLKFCVSSISIVSLGTPICVFADGIYSHNKQLQLDALYMAGAYLASGIIVQTTKHFYKKLRPFQQYAFIVKRNNQSGGATFPSGHTTAAFCTATSLALRFHKWYVVAPAYLWAASVGWGRMYQGVHYPSDILIGAITGTASAWIGNKLEKKLNKDHTGSGPSSNWNH
jgi:membrane-associated phospholipid phosphatase